MFKLGLTGSIGMGKSTTARLFAERGCDIWDADAAVHRLYGSNGAAVDPLRRLQEDLIENDAVSRDRLRRAIGDQPELLPKIEQIVHPLVRRDRDVFIQTSKSTIGVFDIPLLFELGSQSEFDAVACVHVSREIQYQRVMDRKTMTKDQFDLIVSKQMDNDKKCALSDYVIPTDSLEVAAQHVSAIIEDIEAKLAHA